MNAAADSWDSDLLSFQTVRQPLMKMQPSLIAYVSICLCICIYLLQENIQVVYLLLGVIFCFSFNPDSWGSLMQF